MQSQSSYGFFTRTRPSGWTHAAAGFSVLAGILHFSVMPEHFVEWIGYGLFFLIAGLAQFLFALVVLRQPANSHWLLTGILGNGLFVMLWVFTRTVGIPFGPAAGEVESIGTVDIFSKLAELVLMGCLLAQLFQVRLSESAQPIGGTDERR